MHIHASGVHRRWECGERQRWQPAVTESPRKPWPARKCARYSASRRKMWSPHPRSNGEPGRGGRKATTEGSSLQRPRSWAANRGPLQQGGAVAQSREGWRSDVLSPPRHAVWLRPRCQCRLTVWLFLLGTDFVPGYGAEPKLIIT